MDYEKKYKAVLEQARDYYNRVQTDYARKELENIFPELRESEDERLQKLIIDRVRSAAEMTEELRELLLTYLEKQKEPKPAEWSEKEETIIEGACNALEIHGHTKLASMLKSLRPSWRPSEGQMNCLCAAVDAAIRKHNESVSGYEPARVLKSLYEDLQKL